MEVGDDAESAGTRIRGAAFERLFGTSDEDPETRKKNRRYDRSILDGAMEDTKKLERDLGPSDRRKIDEYMSSVREIEARIQKTESDNKEIVPAMDKPVAAPADLSDHARLMYDLMRVAFQTDMTRIATFMLTREEQPPARIAKSTCRKRTIR